MRNCLLLLAALTISMTVSASGNAKPVTKNQSMRIVRETMAKMPRFASDEIPSVKASAPQRITDDGRAEDTDELITDPVGEKKMYVRETDSWYYYYGSIYHAYDYGYAQEVVFGENNEVYFKNPFGGWETDSYLKGEIQGEEIVVNLPQYILNYKNMRYTAKLATIKLEDSSSPVATLSDDQVLRFSYKNGRIKQLNSDVSLAMYGPSNYWVSYADGKYDMTLLDEEIVSAPDAPTKEYSMLYDENGHYVQIATVGNDFYLKGICSSLPDAWIKGTISGNEVTLTPQYLGIIDNHHAYFVPGQITYGYLQEYSQYYITYYMLPTLTLTYDAETDSYTIPKGYSYVINTNKDSADPLDYYDNAVIIHQSDVTAVKPATPQINDIWLTETPQSGENYIEFTVFKTDVDGNLLDMDRLYYNIYFDDEPATFFTDDYVYAKEDMTDFPYDYSDGYDVFSYDGTSHLIYLYGEGFDKIGVQTIYRSSNGEEYRSDIAYYDVASGSYFTQSGIGDVTISKDVKSTEYFDLTGRRVLNPSNGLFIKRVTYTDGSVKTVKSIVK